VTSQRSRGAALLLALRSLLWTAILPGVVAGYVPWRFFGLDRWRPDSFSPRHVVAFLSIGAGAALLGICIWEFASRGRGTLAPVDPPRALVVRGPYRYVRNPMYVAVTMILLGEALLLRSRGLLLYWSVFFLAANLFVIGYEEPALRRRFGEDYAEYMRRVRRWLPRWKPVPGEAAA
jgi:protein-S-isoprenylcysteine O-methyltransferase Ste14